MPNTPERDSGSRTVSVDETTDEWLRLALDAAQMGTWAWNIQTGDIQWSDNLEAIHGMAPGSFDGTFEGYLQVLHPHDRASFQQAIRESIENKTGFRVEFRIVWPDNSVHWIMGKGRAFYDENGQPIRMVGLGMDVTERVASTEALSRANSRNSAMLESITDAFYALDRDWRFTYVNQRAEQILRCSREDLLGKSIWSEYPDTVHTIFYEEFYRASREGTTATFEFNFPPLSTWAKVRAYPSPEGLAVYIEDITDQKVQERERRWRERRTAFGAEVGAALGKIDTLQHALQACAEAMVNHLDAAFARIWTLNSEAGTLELEASAGLYTHLDGPHSRVPVGQFKIGLIAQERTAHLTNSVIGDPRVGDQEWAKREGMVAFAGYPLLVAGEVVGVMAMFSREPIPEDTLHALALAADILAQTVIRKRAEQDLRESEELWRITLRSIGDAVISTDATGNVTFMNSVAELLTGWTLAEATGKDSLDVFRIVNEKTRVEVPSPIDRVLREGTVVGLANHTVIVARHGQEYPIEDSGAPIRNEAGDLVGTVLIFRDVTESRRKEQAVQQSQERLRLVVETALDAVVEIGEDDRILEWNAQAEQTFGWSREGAVGQVLAETIIPSRYREAHRQGMQHYLEMGEGPILNQRIEITALHRDGREFPVELTITSIRTRDATTFSAFIRDMSRQKQAEEQRRQSETRFRLLVEQSPLSIQVLAPDGRMLQVNRAWEQLWGATLDDLRDYNMLQDKQLVDKGIMPFIQRAFGGEPVAIPPVLHDPQQTAHPDRTTDPNPQRWTQGFMYPVKDEAGVIREVVLIHENITEQRQAEKALSHLAAIIRSSDDAIISKDLNGIVTSWNPAAERIYGYTAQEIIGKSKSLLIPTDMPEELPHILRKIRAGERIEHYDTVRVRKDGTRINLSISVSPVHDSKGEIVGASTIARDITERMQHLREIETLNARLQRSIQETHHRVKNNLQVISALAELQTEDGEDTIPASAMQRIGQHTRTLAAIHDLLTNQAKADAHTHLISTKEAMDKLVPLLQATTGGRRIRYQVEDVRLPIRAGASLALLISETVSNAVKHGSGDIEIYLSVQEDNVRLEVCDDGPGFPPDFDWQTQANTGLSLIDSAARYDLRGRVTYKNRIEGGARVVVTIPMTALQSD